MWNSSEYSKKSLNGNCCTRKGQVPISCCRNFRFSYFWTVIFLLLWTIYSSNLTLCLGPSSYMSSSLSPPPGGSRYDHLESQIGSQRQIWRILFLPWETGLDSTRYVVFPFWKSLTNCLFTSASGEEVVGWRLPKRKNRIASWFSCNLEFLLDLMNDKFFKSDIVILGSSSYTSSALAPPVPRSSR